MKEPLVSVIILNWNGERFLENCLCSVLNQSYANLEIIVVDNCSADKSVDILETKLTTTKIYLITSNKITQDS